MRSFWTTLTVAIGLASSAASPAYPSGNTKAKNSVVLDVRTLEEYAEGHVEGSKNIDYYAEDFRNQLARLDKTKTYKVYCRSGNRSSKALEIMKSLGFENVENLGNVSQAAKALGRKCTGSQSC